MKKKSIITLILLITFVIGSVYALQDEPRISGKGTKVLLLANTNPKPPKKNEDLGRLEGELCVYYLDAEGEKRETSVDYNLLAGGTKTVPIPGKIIGWATLYCSVIDEIKN
ncbi:MAG: hypothetical protein LBO67_00590 [Spirochaetaceae bacterium]|nr:hypothetical protein [Spirochaetaceae bacterium]